MSIEHWPVGHRRTGAASSSVTGRRIRIRKAWDYGLVMLLTFILIIISRVDAERTCPAVSIHTATPDTTRRSRLCRVWRGGVNQLLVIVSR